jgi:hypothetical protein
MARYRALMDRMIAMEHRWLGTSPEVMVAIDRFIDHRREFTNSLDQALRLLPDSPRPFAPEEEKQFIESATAMNTALIAMTDTFSVLIRVAAGYIHHGASQKTTAPPVQAPTQPSARPRWRFWG